MGLTRPVPPVSSRIIPRPREQPGVGDRKPDGIPKRVCYKPEPGGEGEGGRRALRAPLGFRGPTGSQVCLVLLSRRLCSLGQEHVCICVCVFSVGRVTCRPEARL